MNRKSCCYSVCAIAVFILLFALSGTPAAAQSTCTGSASQCGSWSTPVSWPVEAIHLNLLPNGKVLFWGPYAATSSYLWDPVADPTGATTVVTPPPPYAGFCSGHVLLANGQLIVMGGLEEGSGIAGIPDARIYDYTVGTTGAWTADGNVPDMPSSLGTGATAGRYYPTATTLPSGDILIISGDGTTGVNPVPQIWQASSPSCSTSPLPTSPLPTSCWENLTGAALPLPLYPKMFVAPNGQVFFAGPTPATRYLNLTGTCPGSRPTLPPVAAPCWPPTAYPTEVICTTNGKATPCARDYGPAALYNNGQIMITGGARPPTPTTEIINLNATKPAWTQSGSMAYPRRQNNGTILPDGTILVTGGTSSGVVCTGGTCTCPPGNLNNDTTCMGFDDYNYPVFPAELWNPTTGQWTTLASMQKYRGYHSTALLLPDGRVVSSGGDFSCLTAAQIPAKVPAHCAVTPNFNTAEIYSPPYLFAGPRPTLVSAPASVTYGQNFFVQTPSATSITQVSWIRLSTVTHTFNESQRINFLTFAQAPSGLTITAPANSSLAPPGYYMLFILENGVPSVAQIVQIQ
jgi:galactose oxidase